MAQKGERHASKKIAAFMREHKIVRTTGRCANCYRIITIDSYASRYTHKCGS